MILLPSHNLSGEKPVARNGGSLGELILGDAERMHV